jgi:hypothetical protein
VVSKELLLKCYEAALMRRWGEYASPVQLDELGRQGQVLQVAFVIAECRWSQCSLKWWELIELVFIRFFRRVALTDIQAPVFDQLYRSRRKELNATAGFLSGTFPRAPGGRRDPRSLLLGRQGTQCRIRARDVMGARPD